MFFIFLETVAMPGEPSRYLLFGRPLLEDGLDVFVTRESLFLHDVLKGILREEFTFDGALGRQATKFGKVALNDGRLFVTPPVA